MKSFIWLTILLYFAVHSNAQLLLTPIISLNSGQIQGKIESVEDGKQIYFYEGIRYGQASRFERPTFTPNWTGIYNATTPRNSCPQVDLNGSPVPRGFFLSEIISEDCLFLNIVTPPSHKKHLSVMIYIHGGGFNRGSIFLPHFDGRYIASRGDVIVVSVNYRLGLFGFNTAGNLALEDVILALKWIQTNIQQFGGKPDSVTIFGNSAGSFLVGALLLAQQANGLFHRAILQSGAPLQLPPKSALFQTEMKVAQHLNCSQNVTHTCLRSKSMWTLLNATYQTGQPFTGPTYGDSILPKKPVEILKSGTYNSKIDLLYGTVRDEGIGFLTKYPEMDHNITSIEIARKFLTETLFKGKPYASEVAAFYLNSLLSNATLFQIRNAIADANGDYSITCPVILFSQQFTSISPFQSTNYAWRLIRQAMHHIMRGCLRTNWSSASTCHADELFFLFQIPKQTSLEEIRLSRNMITAWTNFAKTGKPGKIGSVEWTKAVSHDGATGNRSTTSYMALDVKYQMVPGFFRKHTKKSCHMHMKSLQFL